jgi:hypothetical protein
MNKKLLTYFLLLFLAVAMPSCSNDNDNDEPGSSVEDLIVGVWKMYYDPKYPDEDDYEMLKLKDDGTYIRIMEEGAGYPYREYGTYLIRKSSLYRNKYILTLINSDNSYYPKALQIVSISKNKLVLRYEGSSEGESTKNETYEYTRVE